MGDLISISNFKWTGGIIVSIITVIILSWSLVMADTVVERDRIFSEMANPHIKTVDGILLGYIVDVRGDGSIAQIKVSNSVHKFIPSSLPIIFDSENPNYRIKLKEILGNESKSIKLDIIEVD